MIIFQQPPKLKWQIFTQQFNNFPDALQSGYEGSGIALRLVLAYKSDFMPLASFSALNIARMFSVGTLLTML